MDNHFKYGAEMKVVENDGVAHEGKVTKAMTKMMTPLTKPIIWMSKAVYGNNQKRSKSKK